MTVDADGPTESLSPTLATAFLGCRASAAWDIEIHRGLRPKPEAVDDPQSELIARKGLEHRRLALPACANTVAMPFESPPPRGRHGSPRLRRP